MSTPTEDNANASAEIEVRECATIDDFEACVGLQREAFRFPDVELSPRRHFIVSRQAGGWVLGAFVRGALVGFVHHLPAVRANELYGYSHMLAVKREYQNKGVGARLKWAQRERALAEGRDLIRWTWDPMQARNAHFNLNRLGVRVRSYAVNFYGTDYSVPGAGVQNGPGIDSDRLFAEWELNSDRVKKLAAGQSFELPHAAVAVIEIPAEWPGIIKQDVEAARREQLRVRKEFEEAFASGFVCRGFARDEMHPRYLLFSDK